MITLWLLACVARAPADVRPPVQTTDAFVIRAGERTLAGLAAVAVDEDRWALQALTPTGVSLFTVRGDADGVDVTAPADAIAATLARIPFERDLRLLYRLRCSDRCAVDGGVLTVTGDGTRWRGRQGPALVVRHGDRAVLTDPRRGYTLEVSGEGVRE